MTDVARVVIGTAGHVDHGKTALVRALTGVDCDRLPEERARGISIALGYADWRIEGAPTRISVVDVPGHERFVRTMIAGAQGVDAIVLVIAADDGVMPQTLEHLDVCELLGVRAGVVAITKCDLVDDARAAEVEAEARDLVRGSFLDGAPVVRTSIRDGRGLRELGAAVSSAIERRSVAPVAAPTWLPIDRVLSLAGAGTVVTGTLVRGRLRVGDEVDALPVASGTSQHVVRSLEVHGARVDEAIAPTRVAVALRGEARDMPKRGAVLAARARQRPTRSLLVDLRVLGDLPASGEVVVHVGTFNGPAALRVVERPTATRAWAFVHLRQPIAAYAGERIIVRRPDLTAQRTVAGGEIVDPYPHGKRSIAVLRAASLSERIVVLADEGAGVDEISRRVPPCDLETELASLERADRIVRDGDRVFVAERVESAKRSLMQALARFHEGRAERSGAPLAEITAHAGAEGRVALRALEREGLVIRRGATVHLATHVPGATPLGDQIVGTFANAGLSPPREEDVLRATGAEPRAFRDAVDELKRAGRLRSIGGIVFEASAVEDLKRRVREHFATKADLRPVELKELCGGVARKYAISLLEWLDREGITRRVGDARVPGPKGRA